VSEHHGSSDGYLPSQLALLAAFAGCSSDATTGVGDGTESQLAFTTGGSSSLPASASLIPVTKGGHTLDLTAVTVVLDRASLKKTSEDVCRSDDDDDDDDDHHNTGSSSANSSTTSDDDKREHSDRNCGEVKIGPAIVDLPLDGKLVTLPGNTIPAGTYRELDVRLSLVRLKGTFDGKAFDVTVPIHTKTEIEFDTPLVVTENEPILITVNVPVDTWLVTETSVIDPSKVLTDPALMMRVKLRIAGSIHAFEDRDRDGHDDHRHKRD
jgi:hypothetical protein